MNNPDICKYIAQWLNNRERLFMMMTSKTMMIMNLTFDDQIDLCFIIPSSLYHNFTNISVSNLVYYMNKSFPYFSGPIYPKKMNRLLIKNSHTHEMRHSIGPHIVDQVSPFNSVIIPSTVTHLTINQEMNFLESSIPTSVTHLKYLSNHSANQKFMIPHSVKFLYCSVIPKIIPSSVTHLRINCFYDFNLIPLSVTHLVINQLFIQIKSTYISSVRHLIINNNYVSGNQYIPSTVTHLILINYHSRFIIPETIQYLSLPSDCQNKNIPELSHISNIHYSNNLMDYSDDFLTDFYDMV